MVYVYQTVILAQSILVSALDASWEQIVKNILIHVPPIHVSQELSVPPSLETVLSLPVSAHSVLLGQTVRQESIFVVVFNLVKMEVHV